jgi:hypothetical protein
LAKMGFLGFKRIRVVNEANGGEKNVPKEGKS